MAEGFRLVKEGTGWVLLMDQVAQSWVDLADPSRLEFGYMEKIGDMIDLLAPAGERIRAIHIGGAGLSLPRYICATRPTSAQIVFEPNTELTQFVRDNLPLPRHSGIKIRPFVGQMGIAEISDGYADLVVLDAFASARVPKELVTVPFFNEVARVLANRGVFSANLIDFRPFSWTKRVCAGLKEVFGDVWLVCEPAVLRGRRHGNLVAFASVGQLPLNQMIRKLAGSVFPYRLVYGQGMDRFLTGATGFTDLDAQDSPFIERSPARFG